MLKIQNVVIYVTTDYLFPYFSSFKNLFLNRQHFVYFLTHFSVPLITDGNNVKNVYNNMYSSHL